MGDPGPPVSHGHIAEQATGQDLGLGPLPTPIPLIPEGEYQAISRQAKILNGFKRRTLQVDFEIVGGRYDRTRLPWYCPLPAKGQRPPRSSYFFRAWVMIHGRDLRRGERPSTHHFEGKMFRVRVTTVPDDHHKDPLPDGLKYSRVAKLLERLA